MSRSNTIFSFTKYTRGFPREYENRRQLPRGDQTLGMTAKSLPLSGGLSCCAFGARLNISHEQSFPISELKKCNGKPIENARSHRAEGKTLNYSPLIRFQSCTRTSLLTCGLASTNADIESNIAEGQISHYSSHRGFAWLTCSTRWASLCLSRLVVGVLEKASRYNNKNMRVSDTN